MRDYLSNEIIFNTPVLNKNLYDFISKDSPALRVGSRRIWKTIRIGAYHFCLYACPASKRCQRVRWKTIRTRAYHSWDAKFCDSPPVMRDYLSNEIIFNTPVLNKNLHDFISKDSPALRVGSRRILHLPSNWTRPSWSHSWDAKFCDSPPVMRDYLSNEITFNTPILSKDLMREQFFIHKMFLDMWNKM